MKSKVIISLFETVRLSVSISPRNLYNSLKSIKEITFFIFVSLCTLTDQPVKFQKQQTMFDMSRINVVIF